jgi:hypothetical protein
MPRKKKELTISELSRLGGKGRAKKLSAKQLSEQGRKAAQERWKNNADKKK